MKSRKRVMTALDHKEPDSIPIDLGATQDSTLSLTTYQELAGYFGQKFDNYNLYNWMDSMLYPDDELLKKLNVDTRCIFTGKGKHAELESFYQEVGVKTLEDGGLGVFSDNGQLLYKKPKGAYGFQALEYPLAGELTNERIDNFFKDPQSDHHQLFGISRPKSATKMKEPITTFEHSLAVKIPSEYDQTEIKHLTEKVKWLHENTDYAIIQSNIMGLVVTSMQNVMGYEDWFVNLALSPKELLYATETYLENHLLPFADKLFREIGPYIDVAYCIGDDMATQRGPSFSLEQYRQYFKPMHKKIIETVKKHTQAKIMFHMCGSAYPYLSDLIEIGVDIINPVQNLAADMEPEKLKREFGKDLSFWGAIDTQQILTTGTKEQVIDEVKRKIEILGKDGGYIFAPCHDIQKGTPLENIIAMFETAIFFKK